MENGLLCQSEEHLYVLCLDIEMRPTVLLYGERHCLINRTCD